MNKNYEINPLISIIIPVYNEERTIKDLINRVKKAYLGGLKKEIIVVNDGSNDNSLNVLKDINEIVLLNFKKNKGKGSAVRKGIKISRGNVVIIQDADFEYDPNDIIKCVMPILNKKSKVVYGSRRLNKENKKHSNLLFHFGGILVTKVANILYKSNLTDIETCYKAFDSKVIKEIKIKSNGFEWEPEVTAKILKTGNKIIEVPISYNPRKIKSGKKIKYRDGIKAILMLFKEKIN